MSPNDSIYYRERAQEERAAASSAADERAAKSHLELARQYDEIADNADDATKAA